MKTADTRLGKLAGISVASFYSLYYASTATQWHFIDNVDLIFHEAGHTLFRVFGQFICVCMGSGFQILLPLSIAFYFFYQRQPISAAVCLMWTGMNLINVSIYAGDAIMMQLPLLGGDASTHDWNYILSTLNILVWTPRVASALYGLGVLAIGTGIAVAFAYALQKQVSK